MPKPQIIQATVENTFTGLGQHSGSNSNGAIRILHIAIYGWKTGYNAKHIDDDVIGYLGISKGFGAICINSKVR
jgi:hypothetical protein